jgi:hypothetical protein
VQQHDRGAVARALVPNVEPEAVVGVTGERHVTTVTDILPMPGRCSPAVHPDPATASPGLPNFGSDIPKIPDQENTK